MVKFISMNKKIKNTLIIIAAALVIVSIVFMIVLSLKNKTVNVTEIKNLEMPQATCVTEELTKGIVVEQDFINTTDNITEIAVVFSRVYYLDEKDAEHTVAIELLDGNKTLASTIVKSNDIPDQHRVYLYPKSPIANVVGKELTLKIYENSKCDTGVSLLVSDNVDTKYKFGGSKKQGSICFSITGQ